MDFDDFAEDARELFDLNDNEAADLADIMEEAGFDFESDSLTDAVWTDVASDFVGEVSEEWAFDPAFDGDDWVEADAEYEVTVTYEEGK